MVFNWRKSKRPAATLPEGLRVYAIGDIHGRDDLLAALLEKIDADAEGCGAEVKHIFLGDYIDRGSESRAVLDRLLAFQENTPGAVFLKGNHEGALLSYLDGETDGRQWLQFGGLETLSSYGVPAVKLLQEGIEPLRAAMANALPAAHLDFLRGARLSAAYGDYFFVHAGARPGRPLDKQEEQDLLWIREDFLAAEAPFDKTIVHGHSVTRKPENLDWRIGVDTGAGWNGKLTAVVLQGADRRFISV